MSTINAKEEKIIQDDVSMNRIKENAI